MLERWLSSVAVARSAAWREATFKWTQPLESMMVKMKSNEMSVLNAIGGIDCASAHSNEQIPRQVPENDISAGSQQTHAGHKSKCRAAQWQITRHGFVRRWMIARTGRWPVAVFCTLGCRQSRRYCPALPKTREEKHALTPRCPWSASRAVRTGCYTWKLVP